MAGAPGQQAANSPQQMIQQNAMLRQALLNSAPRMRKQITSVAGATSGSTSRVKLFNVGITTRILLDVKVTYTVGTAAVTASPKAPYNLINRLKLTDFDGTDRVNASGYQLFMINSRRARTPYGMNNEALTSILNSPAAELTVGAGKVARFFIEVPLAYSRNDLRGALLTQTAVGEAWLNIDWNSLMYANGNDDAVFNGAATSTVTAASIDVNVFQEYLLPQQVGNGVPLPALDLMTVYELSGALRSADNIAAGQEKLFNYPNVRSVIAFYANYINNGLMSGSISKFRLIANGNNVLREYGPDDKLFEQRLAMSAHADLKVGSYFEEHIEKPIETALFGNVQYGITPLTASGTTNFEVCFESFYTKGSMLPGLSQASG